MQRNVTTTAQVGTRYTFSLIPFVPVFDWDSDYSWYCSRADLVLAVQFEKKSSCARCFSFSIVRYHIIMTRTQSFTVFIRFKSHRNRNWLEQKKCNTKMNYHKQKKGWSAGDGSTSMAFWFTLIDNKYKIDNESLIFLLNLSFLCGKRHSILWCAFRSVYSQFVAFIACFEIFCFCYLNS